MWPFGKKKESPRLPPEVQAERMEGVLAKRSRKEFLNRDDLDFLDLYVKNLNDDGSYELK
jgi:hypothetical protein